MLDVLAELPLVDHHCHGVARRLDGGEAVERFLSESADPAPPGTTWFDAPLGLAVRRWCAPLIDLEPLAPAEDYMARRLALGVEETNRRFLRAARLEALFVDTGFRSDELLGVGEMEAAAGVPVREVVRLETVAERVAAAGVSAEAYPGAFEQALCEAAEDAVGLKTVLAYRGGLEVDPLQPERAEVVRAAGRWFGESAGRPARLTDPVLLRHAVWVGAMHGAERGMPLQIHSGLGDPDLTLHRANPSLATPLLRALQPLGTSVIFLHCYPYQREAAYLAAVFPHVGFDVGLALHSLGPSAVRLMGEALELAPFSKQLFSSDGIGLPELHFIAAQLFRHSLAAVLERWIGEGYCTAADAERIAMAVGRDNARRLYRRAPQ